MLAALILKAKEEKDTFIVRQAKRFYLPLLDRALDNKGKVIGAAVVLLVASLAAFPFLGKEFMPTLQEGTIMFRVTGIPSTSLEESIAVSKRFDAVLKQHYPQVTSTLATIGRAEKGETADVNYMEVLVDVKPPEQWAGAHGLSGVVCRNAGDTGESDPHGRVRRHPADPDARRGTHLRCARHPRPEDLRRGPGHAGTGWPRR